MFGFSFEKLIVIGVIAALIIGPSRLPAYAASFAAFVARLRRLADTATDRIRDEMGPEFDEVEWKKLDPRQYDPRRIIRTALLDVGSSVEDSPEVPLEPAPEASSPPRRLPLR